MKNLIVIIFSLFSTVLFGQGSLIILNGTSSAGKSTLAKTLQESLTKSYGIVSIDDFVYPQLLKMAQHLGLVSTQTMTKQQINKIIANNVAIILASFDKSNQSVKWETLKSGMYQEVADRVQNGENIILDTVLSAKEFEDASDFVKILGHLERSIVLVYGSPISLIKHVLKRNSCGDDIQRRDIVRVIRSFCDMYGLAADDSDVLIVDHITQDHVLFLIDTIYDNPSFGSSVDQHKAAQEIEKILQDNFFSNGNEIAFLVCRCPHDLSVDLGKMSLQQAAMKIESCI